MCPQISHPLLRYSPESRVSQEPGSRKPRYLHAVFPTAYSLQPIACFSPSPMHSCTPAPMLPLTHTPIPPDFDTLLSTIDSKVRTNRTVQSPVSRVRQEPGSGSNSHHAVLGHLVAQGGPLDAEFTGRTGLATAVFLQSSDKDLSFNGFDYLR